MSRADILARRVVALSRPSAPTDLDKPKKQKQPKRVNADPDRKRTKRETADRYSTHPAQVDRWVELGCPATDIAVHRPGARLKRNLRFDLAEVEKWLRGRS